MSERIDSILAHHATSSFGTRENLKLQERLVAEHYRSLEAEDASELARLAIEGADPTAADEAEMILRCLACLRPGSLRGHHEALHGREWFYPPVIYHGAGDGIARRLLDALPGDAPDHILEALAWVGGPLAEEAFHGWRKRPPSWARDLDIPPDRFSLQAGWQPTADGRRRELVAPACRPLVPSGGDRHHVGDVRVVEDDEGTCGWCGRGLTALIDLDAATAGLVSPSWRGRLRIASCERCSCYGLVFTRIGPDGASNWHESNARPEDLPDAADEDEWGSLPRGCLVLGEAARPAVEAADWLVPGVRFSQVGGYPTWVQDAEYPDCPGCSRPMPFVAQISNEDCDEFAEGLYYLFACADCGVAATAYQQS